MATISFVLVRIAVLNIFYSIGDMQDPGWIASVTWRNRWRLPGPDAYPGSYFFEHLALILWFTNALSFIVPMSKFDYYAVCIAIAHAIYAAGIFVRGS